MTYGIDIFDLMQSQVKAISDEATKARELKLKYNSGMISESEYKELCNDIARIDKVDSLADDIETRTKITEAFKLILKFLI